MVKITLVNSKKVPFWNIPGTKLAFSYLDPDGLEIDFDNLHEKHKQTIIDDIRKGLIKSDKELVLKPVVKVEPVVVEPVEVEKTREQLKLEEYESLLSNNFNGFKKGLEKVAPSDFKPLLSLEENNRKRAGVIKLLKLKILELEKEVQASVNKVSESVLANILLPEDEFLSDVSDSEEKEVKIFIPKEK